MPRYDYECKTCHHVFELKQSFDAEPFTDCIVCGNEARRKFQVVPIVFKGSGWYVNDYGKGAKSSADKKRESADGESGDKASDDSGSKPKSESKSETKSKKETAAAKTPTD